MNNKDDIVGRIEEYISTHNVPFLFVKALNRIKSDAKRIAELEAEVERLKNIGVKDCQMGTNPMTPREKLARVIEPDAWKVLDNAEANNFVPRACHSKEGTLSLCAADRILERWPDIEKIVEGE